MSKILAVFGATGQQGGSVIDYVLSDPELSRQYRIRAITRDVTSEKAKQLKEKVEVVQGDAEDRASLETALTGSHTIFAMTAPYFGPDEHLEIEYNSAKNIADVAVEKNAIYLIFSTLPGVKEISRGKYTKVTHFESKAKAERYMRGLPIKTAFYSPAGFMSNFNTFPVFSPKKSSDGSWVLTTCLGPKSKVALVDVVGDTGKFIGAILAEPDVYEGKTFCAATAFYSYEEITAIMSKASGKTVVIKQIPTEDFKKSMPYAADVITESFCSMDEFGYWGSDSEDLVAWAGKHARGKLTTFEEYLEANPLQLQ